jgi:hypothetical protein
MSSKTASPRTIRIEHSHRRGCSALASANEYGGGPFCTFADRDPFVFCNRFANPNVKNGKYHPYMRVRCNDPKCSATALVHIDSALRAVGLNLEAPDAAR